LTTYHARVWIKSRGKFAHFYLGLAPKQAQRRLDQILGDPESALAKRNTPPPAPAMAFEELVKAFVKGYRSRGESGYHGMISAGWVAWFGKRPADAITRATIEDYRDALHRDGYSDSTIRKSLTALGTCYRWARLRGLVNDDPRLEWARKGEGVKRPPEPDREVAVLTRDEEAALLEATGRDERPLIRLFIESGMRLSEGLTLTWGQVDRASGSILIHKSKTGKARAIPLRGRGAA
jgi:hypothetical protein